MSGSSDDGLTATGRADAYGSAPAAPVSPASNGCTSATGVGSVDSGNQYSHWHAWLGGMLLHGFALVAIGLAGPIAVLLRDVPSVGSTSGGSGGSGQDTLTLTVGGSVTAAQWFGFLYLAVCVVGFSLSHAAGQDRSRLPAPVAKLIMFFERLLRRLPLVDSIVVAHGAAGSTSRLIAIVGPIVCAFGTGIGAALATGLGLRALFLGAAFSGFAASLSGMLLERIDTRVQTGGMFVALVSGAVATYGLSLASIAVVLGGALWIVIVTHLREAIGRGASWATFTMIGVGLATFAVLSELDNTLQSLAIQGVQPRGFGALAPLTDLLNTPDRVSAVSQTWLDFRVDVDSAAGINAPSDHLIRSLYVLVDSAGFAIAYSLLMIAAVRHLSARLRNGSPSDQDEDDERRSQLLSILEVTRFAIPIVLILDIAENVSGAAAVMAYLPTEPASAEVATLAPFLAFVHWGAAATKTVGLAGAVVAIVAAAGQLVAARRKPPDADEAKKAAEAGDSPEADEAKDVAEAGASLEAGEAKNAADRSGVRLVSALRIQRANIVLVAALFLALRNPQTFDAIRRLAHGDALAWELLLLLGLVGGCAVAIRYLSELLERQLEFEDANNDAANTEDANADAANDEGGDGAGAVEAASGVDGRTSRRAHDRVIHGSLAAAVAIVFAWLLGAPGALIPIVMWLVLEALSIPLRREGAPDRRRLEWVDVWTAIGIVGMVLLAAWVARAWWGGAGVRWLLVAFGVVVLAQGMSTVLGHDRIRAAWFGLRPLLTSVFGLVPLVTRVGPWLFWRLIEGFKWVVDSMVSRLFVPVRNAFDTVLRIFSAIRAGQSPRRARSTDDRIDEPPTDAGDPPEGTSVEPEHPDPSGVRVARALGGLVPFFVGSAMIRSSLGLTLYDSESRSGFLLLLVGVGVVLAGSIVFVLPSLTLRATSHGTGIAVVRLAVAAIFVGYLIGWQVVDVGHVIAVSQSMTAIGVLSFAIALFAVIGTAISYLTEHAHPLPALKLVGFSRVPFFILILVWVVIASSIDRGGYHNVPTHEAVDGAVNVKVNARLAFDDWVEACAAETSRQAVPMVFVAASGGGIRAAYWTATALERFDAEVARAGEDGQLCRQPVFAASGASGGSLGLGVWAANGLTAQPGEERVAGLLDDDFLAPTVGWFLVADVVRPFVLWDLDGDNTVDRARVLELAWEDAWEAMPVRDEIESRCFEADSETLVSLASGLRETWCLGAPLLLLNGTEVNSACRFNTSVLDNRTLVRGETPTPVNCTRPPSDVGFAALSNGPFGATLDVVDYICPTDDISLSTAALLSARFPFISPSGRVGQCGASDAGPSFVVDGGYIDNSGASPLVELWAEVVDYVDDHNAGAGNTCIVPVFVQLDNGYDTASATPPQRPLEFTVPLTAAVGARGSREAEAKQIAANIFTAPSFSTDRRAYVGDRPLKRWVRIVPEAHPGVQAPLGWVLSDAARADLDAELDRDEGFTDLNSLLRNDVTCRT